MAREWLLRDAGEDTIHQNYITPQTGKEKAENWWFHHRVKVITGIVAAAMLFSIFFSIFSKEKADYTVFLVTSYTMPTDGVNELRRCFEQYADDRNGDGKVVVHVETYVFSDKMTESQQQFQQEQAALARFSVDLSLNDSMLVFHDDTAFQVFAPDCFDRFFQYNDGTPIPEGATDFENAMIAWEDIPGLASFVPQMMYGDMMVRSDSFNFLYRQLRLSVRTDVGADFDEKTQQYYEDSMAFKDRLFAGVSE